MGHRTRDKSGNTRILGAQANSLSETTIGTALARQGNAEGRRDLYIEKSTTRKTLYTMVLLLQVIIGMKEVRNYKLFMSVVNGRS